MPDWDSHTATPPSLVYPPDGSGKWYARRDLPGTRMEIAPNGKLVCIGEIRGWLHKVSPTCNGDDPDWHYGLEVDLDWLDQLGIAVDAFQLPGDVGDYEPALGEVSSRSSVRAKYGIAHLEVELDGWQRTDPYRGQPPLPPDWTTRNTCWAERGEDGRAVWPYAPLNPKEGDPVLAVGQYVRMVGSLVTDEPHMMRDQIATNFVLRFGYESAAVRLPPSDEHPTSKERADFGQDNAIKWMWSESRTSEDEGNPARWNEMHSPDYIQVLSAKPRSETVRCIKVVAQNGLFSGDVEEITAEVPAPPRPSARHTVYCKKRVGASTLRETVRADEVTLLEDRVRVHVKVEGQGGMGANGKFHAIYRVGWQPPSSQTLEVSPGDLHLGRVEVGSSSAKTLRVTNVSPDSVRVSCEGPPGRGRPFAWDAVDQVLAPNQELSIQVEFFPAGEGPASGSLRVVSEPGGSVTVRLRGTGFGGGPL